MNISYCLVKHKIYDDITGMYTTYGIALLPCANTDELEFLDFVSDVSSNFEDAGQLVHLLNCSEVSPAHFRDVVSDYITEKHIDEASVY